MSTCEATECTFGIIRDRAIVDRKGRKGDPCRAEHDTARQRQHHDPGIGSAGYRAAL